MTSNRGRRVVRIAFVAVLCGSSAGIAPAAFAQAPGQADLAPPPPPDDDGYASAPPPEAEPPAAAPDQATFEAQLSAYGSWVDTAEYGRVWVPAGTASDWQPYTDGYWVDTRWGWSFVSTVPWGWAAFHYGRWGFGLGVGWFWVPGFVWAPAWVSWRSYPGYVCWSPFAPAGFAYGRHWPGWVVLPARHFTRPIVGHRVAWAHAAPIIRAASPVASIASARAARAPVGPAIRPAPPGRGTTHPPARATPGFRRSSVAPATSRAGRFPSTARATSGFGRSSVAPATSRRGGFPSSGGAAAVAHRASASHGLAGGGAFFAGRVTGASRAPGRTAISRR